MEYIEIDKTTGQVLSAGSNEPMYDGEIIEIPIELPERKDPTINICDYYWDGKQFVYRPEGNIHKERKRDALLDNAFNKAIVEILEAKFNMTKSELKTAIKNKIDKYEGLDV